MGEGVGGRRGVGGGVGVEVDYSPFCIGSRRAAASGYRRVAAACQQVNY
jgi:hypothetical protein